MLELPIFLAFGITFIILGIYTIFMKGPAHFWSNFKNIEPKDYKPYNFKVGLLWIGFGIYAAILGIISYFIEGNIKIIILLVGLPFGVIALIILYARIELIYKNK